MPYIPLSKITKLNAKLGLLEYADGVPFQGDYIKTNDGKYYSGHSNIDLGFPLRLIETEILDDSKKQIGFGLNVKIFSQFKKSIKNRLQNVKPIPVVKNTPTELDYDRGYYNRYFCTRINSDTYIEISKDTFDSIQQKDNVYDYNLYNVGSIKWFIKGNDVHRRNSLEIKKTERQFPRIFFLFPVLTEFLRPSIEGIEDLYTNGNELYYGDGTEYIGPYHIHPLKGPMVGAKHIPYPHPKLYYFNQLPEIGNQTYEDFLANYNRITCYKCMTYIDKFTGIYKQEVISATRSRLLGCPENSFSDTVDSNLNVISGYDLAQEACPPLPMLYSPDMPIDDIGGINTTTGGFGGGGFDDFTNYPGGGNYSNFSLPPTNFSGGSGGGGYTGGGGIGTYTGTCFTANTLITMADGSEKTISSIKVGEKVKSEIGESTVLEVKIHKGDHEVYSINGGKPFVTKEHPFKTIDGWKAIDPFLTFEKHQISSDVLNLQDIVYKINGKEMIESIKKGDVIYPKVYNLSLDNEHVFYANGYLVHNDKFIGIGTGLDPFNDDPLGP